MESLAGHLLIASRQLLDPNFVRTLVLLIEHTEEGAFGLIVNRALNKTVQELWRELGSAPCQSRQPVHLGGPVPGPLVALHTHPGLAEIEPAPGIYFAAKKQHLDRLVLSEEPSYKIFVGHSGWGAGQLENELAEGAWHTMPATADFVFSANEAVWENAYRLLGQEVLQSFLKLKNLPPDPTVN